MGTGRKCKLGFGAYKKQLFTRNYKDGVGMNRKIVYYWVQ